MQPRQPIMNLFRIVPHVRRLRRQKTVRCSRIMTLCCFWAMFALSVVSSDATDLPVRKVIHQYALTSANDFPQRDPEDWRLLGSNDGGQTWVTLDVRTNELFSTRQQRKLYQIANETAFGAYRLEIDRVLDPGEIGRAHV